MREIVLKKGLRWTKMELFDSIKEISAERDHEIERLFVLDAGVGSDMKSVYKHHSLINKFLANGKVEEAMEEQRNLMNNYYMIVNGLDVNSFCFMGMIKSIDGEDLIDLSEGNLKGKIKELSKRGLTKDIVSNEIAEVKKKFKESLNLASRTGMEIVD